ncbi:MAG: hypothetical protein LBM19_02210 [Holosporales bacterium]|jgi:hypothetical protein|nr:hypothetical protein [Holosporales bacterium]
MLRNSLKVAICGLIILATGGCSNTRLLLGNSRSLDNQGSYDIKIKADPYAEYKIRNIIEKSLPLYGVDLKNYKITIVIVEKNSSVAYTEKEVAKEQVRIAAEIEIYDKEYNKLSEKCLDTFSTYEVCDTLPYSDLASRKQAINAMLNDLGNAITLAIVSEMRKFVNQ